jgi:hypothetical protein
MARRNIPQQGGRGNMIMGGDTSGMAYVDGEMLKEVSVPVETLLGAANGALTGAVISSVVSGAVTLSQKPARGEFLSTAFSNIFKKDKHLIPVLIGASVLTAIGGIVRYSRAQKHNEWSERHYAFLEQQDKGHVEKIDDQRENAAPDQSVNR